ncbi:hypothetical protein PtA15_17A167 [Puccinia triticina]|uniref:Major facilitator superfamily (MFS) profile domain-containing protein n=1 Tax=Puccinia triticina TaxID=208348 RepID=A0ABY7D729_9BASI|nr:uncharacterized protein PtA15_17A167 [Puccinia triticina]WAQ92685.1 hypothetical protein PtA15_17A167 [Puccinia triticina]
MLLSTDLPENEINTDMYSRSKKSIPHRASIPHHCPGATTSNFKEQESEKKLEPRQGNLGMETIATHENASSLTSISSSSTSSSRRPIFLLGLGQTALVALFYSLEIGQPIHGFSQPLGSFGALSIPSVSARWNPGVRL